MHSAVDEDEKKLFGMAEYGLKPQVLSVRL